MAVTGTITTRFIDEKGLDLGKQLVEKDYLISVYPNLVPQLKSAGLFVWGYNYYGQLGGNTRVHRSSPIQTIAFGTNWRQVSCGVFHTGAIKTDGTLWMWGDGYQGKLGNNTSISTSSPVQTISATNDWNFITCGKSNSCGIKNNGTLFTWGSNNDGQLGDNSFENKSSPVQTIAGGTNWRQASIGDQHMAAVKTDGTLWLWGYNYYGALGNNTNLSKSSPVQTVTLGTNWTQVSCRKSLTAAIKADGTLWLWGRGNEGQLGNNSTATRSSPVQTVTGGTNWKQVSCGYNHTCAVKTDGTLWCWGSNQFGQIGNNSTVFCSSPIQTIAYGNTWRQVTCGSYHTLAQKSDGTIWLWGKNSYGNLGNNTTINRSSPIQSSIYLQTWKTLATDIAETSAAILDFNY